VIQIALSPVFVLDKPSRWEGIVNNSEQNRSNASSGKNDPHWPFGKRFGAAQARFLMPIQRKEIRGLRTRWERLSSSYAVDSQALTEQLSAFQDEYRRQATTQSQTHKEQLNRLITDWDDALDQTLQRSELSTLEKIQWERSTLKVLKSKRKDAETKQRTDYENLCKKLEVEFQNKRAQVKLTRDQAISKLTTEVSNLDESLGEIRDWVSLKTANTALSQKEYSGSEPPRSWDHINTLSAIAKEYEVHRKSLSEKQNALQSNSLARIVSPVILLVLGIAFAAIGYAIASAMAYPPLISIVAGLLAAVLVPAIVYLSTLPMIAKSLRDAFDAVLGEEQSLRGLLQRGKQIAEGTYRNEIAQVESLYKQQQDQAEQTHQQLLRQMEEDYRANKASTLESTVREKARFCSERIESFDKYNRRYPEELEKLTSAQKQEVDGLRAHGQEQVATLNTRFRDSQKRLTKRWKYGVAFVHDHMKHASEERDNRYPDWYSSTFENEEWSRQDSSLALPLGDFTLSVSPSEDHPAKARASDWDQLNNLAARASQGDPLPFFYDLLGNGGLILQSDDAKSRETSQLAMRNLLLRAVTSLPAGMLHVTVIDPEGLGKQYSWLMHLADIAPELVNHRVWTQPIHIADQLALTARHIEDVIQQSLRNQYRNLYEYNQQAGPMAIPYRLIVWSGFPFGLDDSSWQSLCSILSSGSRCGVGVLLDWSTNVQWPNFADRQKLLEFALHGIVKAPAELSAALPKTGPSGTSEDTSSSIGHASRPEMLISTPEFQGVPIRLAMPPDEGTVARIMQKHLIAATNIGKRIVPFDSLKKGAELAQRKQSADGLEIPIGISDAGRVQYLALGEGTSQHVLIAGKTGSGKSSLLHTLISSSALEYAPDQLRLVLLDFKKGVEFQVYSELQLSHTDIIGIESRREFGLSTLEYLDKVLSARGEAFRNWGVQDLPTLKRKHPDVKLPRILIVIDEFQELFVEDDKLSQQAAMLMDRIVRQGRSFGMHLVLASQTLGGAYSLPRTTLAQMAVRIALQCDSADAMLILGEDNTAAERLRYSGQGIYNAGGGRLEANENFQVAYLPKTEQVQLLRELPSEPIPHSPLTNSIGRRIVFEGHKLAVWDPDTIGNLIQPTKLSAKTQLSDTTQPSDTTQLGEKQPAVDLANTAWVLGDSVSIEPPVMRVLSRSPGRNALIVANQDDLVASALGSWLATERSRPGSSTSFWILDGSRSEDSAIQQILKDIKSGSKSETDCKISALRDVESTMESLHTLLSERLMQPNATHPSLVVFVLNLARFRELRREEDYSFGSSGDAGLKPDAVLAKLLSDGPSVGIHVCLWSDSASTLSRWLSRGSMRDIEVRVLAQMSANDSNQLIDSNQANRLDRYVMLLHDDADGRSVKFRPFTLESLSKRLCDQSNELAR